MIFCAAGFATFPLRLVDTSAEHFQLGRTVTLRAAYCWNMVDSPIPLVWSWKVMRETYSFHVLKYTLLVSRTPLCILPCPW